MRAQPLILHGPTAAAGVEIEAAMSGTEALLAAARVQGHEDRAASEAGRAVHWAAR